MAEAATLPHPAPPPPPQSAAARVAPPAGLPLAVTFVSQPICVADFQRDAVHAWASLRHVLGVQGASPESLASDVETLRLDDVLAPTVLDTLRTLSPLLPLPPPDVDEAAPDGVVVAPVGTAFTAGEDEGKEQGLQVVAAADTGALIRVRDSRAAALAASPLSSLKALSARDVQDRVITGGVKRRKGPDKAPLHAAPALAGPSSAAPDTVVTFSMFFRSIRPKREYLGQEVRCLASQKLTCLRDVLCCPSDAAASQFGCATRGAFFYMEGTFYNDMRAPGATDLSAPLLEFARTSPLEVAGEGAASHVDGMPMPVTPISHGGPLAVAQRQHFSTAKMEAIRVGDLTLRVGATYVYTHQGDCEHALRCTDIRLATPHELETASSFPVTTYKLQRQQRKCAICEAAVAAKVVYNSRLAPETPCFFCQECFQRLHYSADGQLLFSDFEVYDVV